MNTDPNSPEAPGKPDDSTLTIASPQGAKPDAASRTLPETIGRYRIIRLIGEGGMGAVYEAEQEQPRRRVALKVIKAAWATPGSLRRFEQESQVLARLQHPGIAQVYEAGTADTGSGPQPYFAMEFIANGRRLTRYAEAEHLNVRQKLELMAEVCDAVQHAHQRSIIHRDLKPGNILVDESGRPKILDFGVARMTDSDALVTRQTDVGQLIGTLAYMSPEQALADPLALDTRSDVYALGVILYELLAGRLPYPLGRTLYESLQAIRETDPASIVAVDPAYRGDIETIVTKALEKDKTRRYSSPADLAADIRRYLHDQPIQARPSTVAYQVKKFASRHKALVAGFAAAILALIAGTVVSTWQAIRASHAERAAIQERDTSKAVNDFLQNDLLAQASATTQADRKAEPDPDLKVRTALDRAAAAIAGKFEKQPVIEASIRQTIGTTYRDLGSLREAAQQLERAYEVRRRVLGETHRDTLASLSSLGAVYRELAKYDQAESMLTKALELRRRALGEEDPDTIASISDLSTLFIDRGRLAQAESLAERGLDLRRKILGPEDRGTLASMDELARLYGQEGKFAKAEELLSKSLEIRHRVLGPEHPETLANMTLLASVYQVDDKQSQAEQLYVQVLGIQRKILGPDHPNTVDTAGDLATVYHDQGKYALAEPLYREVLADFRRRYGLEHPRTVSMMINLAELSWDQGQFAPAEVQETQTVQIARRALGPEHPMTLYSQSLLAAIHASQGKYARAEQELRQVVDVRRRVLGPGHPNTLTGIAHLGGVMIHERKYAAAEPLLREARAGYEKLGSQSDGRAQTQSLLGASLAGQRKYADAEPLLVNGYQGMSKRSIVSVPDRSNLAESGQWIVQLYESWAKPEKAAEWREKLASVNTRTRGQ
jgi:eukaryotic-like serine/threonine-protein kinase